LLIKGLSKKTIFFLLTFLCLQLVAVNEKDDFVYDLSLATQGISVSQYNTGVNYSIGRGINKDVEKAVYWYQRANEQGHSKAPFNIAIFYVDGINTDPDPELALEYFLVAEERGNKHAKEFLDKLRRADNPDLREALLKFCCPEPLSHSMIPKN
jgi:TPR repeat protein|tara:strand:+ start:725 stop:1186 length:462 start_codon:yes stop_codon:yes gene_type:complete